MRRAFVAATAFTVLLVGAPASGATRGTDSACPTGRVPTSQYIDVSGSVHRGAIDCLTWWAVDIFGGSGGFNPTRALTRGEHAAVLSNLLDATGLESLGSTADQGFDDVKGHRYERQINRLASLDVLNGKSVTRFDPDGTISRDAMATLIVQLHERVYGATVQPGSGFSDASGNVHEDNIRRLVAMGVTAGRTATTYDPAGLVTREQIASFTMRHADLLIELGQALPPDDFNTITLSGAGDDVVDVTVPNDALAIATITHNGSGYFGVWVYDESGNNEQLPVNTIGPYSGTHVINFTWYRQIGGFDVSADGAWSIVISPAVDVRKAAGAGVTGSGDDVVWATILAGTVVDIAHQGDGHFAVWAYDRDGQASELLVNDIGAYSGSQRVPADTVWLGVSADGSWSIVPGN